MRIAPIILAAFILLSAIGCNHSVPMATLDQTASDIFDGVIAVDQNGKCPIDAKNKVVGDTAYVTTQPDGTKLILFRTWQGKGANLRGILYSNGPLLAAGTEIEVVTFQPTGTAGGLPIGQTFVSIDSAITKSSYRVSRSLD